MDISEPLKELGEIDIEELRAAILGLDAECWRQNLHRQQEYEVHKSTESVVHDLMLTFTWNHFCIKCTIMRTIRLSINWNFFHAIFMSAFSAKPANLLYVS